MTYIRVGLTKSDPIRAARSYEEFFNTLSFLDEFISFRERDPGNANYREQVSNGYRRLAHALMQNGDTSRAIANFREARANLKELTRDHPNQKIYKIRLASLDVPFCSALRANGELEEARKIMEPLPASLDALRKSDPRNASIRSLQIEARLEPAMIRISLATPMDITQDARSELLRAARDGLREALEMREKEKPTAEYGSVLLASTENLRKQIARVDGMLKNPK